MGPRESHKSEETLHSQPLYQFQAQRSDNITENSIVHSRTNTPSQSELLSDTITENISNNISSPKVKYQPNTSSECEIFCIQIMMLIVNPAAGKLQDHHHQSLVTLQLGSCTHPFLKWQ